MADVTTTLKISDSEKPKWNLCTAYTNKTVAFIEALTFADTWSLYI
jgi:hypothetical protein